MASPPKVVCITTIVGLFFQNCSWLPTHDEILSNLGVGSKVSVSSQLVTARIRSMTGRYCFHRCLSVNISRGGVPGLRFSGGGYLVSDFRGGGVPGLRFLGGGGTWSQIFLGGYLVLVKGKIFDSRFGLIHVQTGEKIFLLRDPPLPQ